MKVIKPFVDLLDDNYSYQVGDSYPRDEYLPTKERIESLASTNNSAGYPFIEAEDKLLDKLTVKELTALTKEKGVEVPEKAEKDDLLELLKENGQLK